MYQAQFWIDQLHMQPHPEGGYFAEVYRASESISQAGLPERYTGPRSLATHIYFLVTPTAFSAFHRLQTDELWHFYAGQALHLHLIAPDGSYRQLNLGPHQEADSSLCAVVPAHTWFAAELAPQSSYTLCGCTLAPGFEYADFELARRSSLSEAFPQHQPLIERLTRS